MHEVTIITASASIRLLSIVSNFSAAFDTVSLTAEVMLDHRLLFCASLPSELSSALSAALCTFSTVCVRDVS